MKCFSIFGSEDRRLKIKFHRYSASKIEDSQTCLAWKAFTKKSVGPLVSSQEQRALLVSVINRQWTARRSLICSRIRFKWYFFCLCFKEDVQSICSRCLGEYDGGLFPGRTVLSASSSDRFRLVRSVLTRPWYVRVLDPIDHNLFNLRLRTSKIGVFRFSDMPCIKIGYRDKKASAQWSAARKKKRFSSRW